MSPLTAWDHLLDLVESVGLDDLDPNSFDSSAWYHNDNLVYPDGALERCQGPSKERDPRQGDELFAFGPSESATFPGRWDQG